MSKRRRRWLCVQHVRTTRCSRLHLVADLVLQLLAPRSQQLDLGLVLRQQALLVLPRLAELACHLLSVLLRPVELASQLLLLERGVVLVVRHAGPGTGRRYALLVSQRCIVVMV